MLCVARIGPFAILERLLENTVDVVYEIDKFCARECVCVSGNVCWSLSIPT